MPSTYSPSLRLELIGNGEQAGTWGTTTNNNLGTLIEQAVTGVQPITLTGGDYTLTDYNGLPDESRNAVLVFGGLLAAPCNVIAPSSEKTYIVRNFSNATVTIKTASGNGVSIANAASEVIFCDGSDFYSATQFNYIDGNLTVSNDLFVLGNATIDGNVILPSDVYGNVNAGQWYLPTGNTATRTLTPINGLVRYNSELHIYEGYQNSTWVRFQTYPQGNYSISYLVAAGGGGGGPGISPDNNQAGGGGGGGVRAGSYTVDAGNVYTIVVGAGGAPHVQGNPSSLTDQTTSVTVSSTTGGGFGGYNSDNADCIGGDGGCGGGSGRGAAGYYNPGSGIAGEGYDGAHGGGGAGTNNADYVGGSGLYSIITGTGSYFGGGGGASGGHAGGIGGGGQGGNAFGVPGPTGISGTVNTGGGGGACGGYTNGAGSGGSGVVILAVPTTNYSGTYTGTPTITVSGANTILKFTASGTYTA